MQAESPNTNWNELQFLSWSEFQAMAPSIVQLEITRLAKAIPRVRENTDFCNSLVRARFALTRFVACVENAEKDSVEKSCSPHLHTAIMNVSFQPDHLDKQTKATCNYVLDRLEYIYDRIRLIY